MAQGLISLIPVAVVLGTVLLTKRSFVSVLCGVFAGFLLLGRGDMLESLKLFGNGLYRAMSDATIIWIILIVVLFGGWATIMEGSGGFKGISAIAEKLIKTRKMALLGVWILGVLFFFDDYLNVFAVSAIMKRITDKFKISRELLAFIISSTGAAVCTIVPFSSWWIFMLGLMGSTGMMQGIDPIAGYMHTIPYILYGWSTVLLVPLLASGVLPLFGPMKESESRAMEASSGSQEEFDLPPKHMVADLVAPMLLLAVVTIVFKNILTGLFASLLLCFALYIPQKLMKSGEYFALLTKGMIKMFPVAAIVILAFVFQIINYELGLVDFVIYLILNHIPGALLPVTIFVVMALLSYVTGSFWVLAAIAFPIVECLAAIIGVDPFLCAGALISAVALGGSICMYSDTVLLTDALTKVTNYDYLKTSFPLIMVPFSLSAILYVIMGLYIA